MIPGRFGVTAYHAGMTMLNGEPIETPNISTAPAANEVRGGRPQDATNRVLGLVSLVLAFVFPLAGAIVGGIAMSQARRGGYTNSVARVGFWLGLVLTILIVAGVVIVIVATGSVLLNVLDICQELGPGVHHENGVTYECTG